LRTLPAAEFAAVSLDEALAHPNWRMGPKITIDSATLMNKGLEVIEAHWLFGVPRSRIEVVVHPQSVIHSMVAFADGAVMAQLGRADMKQAIAYALSCPRRLGTGIEPPDFVALGTLTFEAPDLDRFRCLALAFEACDGGGTLPAVLNAANEIAVEAFLEGRVRFDCIPHIVERVLGRHDRIAGPNLDALLAADRWARRIAAEEAARLES
jgi:1-deoxy-D-xylulose-5-phosphate reductoisomerase